MLIIVYIITIVSIFFMAIIGITLNDVLRDFTGKFIDVYDKYISETSLEKEDITDFDFTKHFNFKNLDSYNSFVYQEAPLEIFGHADQVSENLMTKINKFYMDITDDEEHSIILVSREVDKSIPSTLFYLSKTSCKISKLNFVKTHKDEWEGVDVLITANPIALENKPNNKISIKINTPYNQNIISDYSFDSILDFIENNELRENILNTKTITYEKIN